MTRGGKRPGSGRKALGRKSICWRVAPETADQIKAIAQEAGTGPGEVVDFLLAEYTKRNSRD